MNVEIMDRLQRMEQGIVPEGYKSTKIGIIPIDWEVKKLGEVGEFLRGKGIPKSEIRENGVDCIIYGEIYTRYDYFTKDLYSKVDGAVADTSRDIEYGDLLFTSSGETSEEIGKCLMYLGNKRVVAGGDIVVMRPNEIIKNKVYSYMLNSKAINKQKYKLGQGHSVVHLYESHLKVINVSIIPLGEQEKIANILSTWDKAIERTEQLIQKKEVQKKGLMQQLLTGKTRLPGFTGEWEIKKLEEITIEKGIVRGPFGSALKKSLFVKRGYKVYEQGNAINRDKNYGKYYIDEIKYKELERFKVEKDDFIVSCSGTIGKIYQIPKEFEEGVINQALLKLTIDNNIMDNIYFKNIFESEKFQNKITESTQGGAMKNLVGMKIFRNTMLLTPPLSEQKAIAKILSTADQEIELLNKLLASKQLQKKGLMQLLLTGIVRV